jgi:hypothetical protein
VALEVKVPRKQNDGQFRWLELKETAATTYPALDGTRAWTLEVPKRYGIQQLIMRTTFLVAGVAFGTQTIFVFAFAPITLRNSAPSGTVAVVVVKTASCRLVKFIYRVEGKHTRHMLPRSNRLPQAVSPYQ